jgi:hypothetical protein
MGIVFIIIQLTLLKWLSVKLDAATIIYSNITLLGVYCGEYTNQSWFLDSMPKSQSGQILQHKLSSGSPRQLRLFMVGLQSSHDILSVAGNARIFDINKNSIDCKYVTDKDHFVSSGKVCNWGLVLQCANTVSRKCPRPLP